MIKKAKKQANCYQCGALKQNERSEFCDTCRENLLKAKVRGDKA